MSAASRAPRRSVLRVVGFLVRTGWRISRARTVMAALEPLASVIAALPAFLLALIVAALGRGALREAMVLACLLALSVVAEQTLGLIGLHMRVRLLEEVGAAVDRDTALRVLSLTDQEALESPEIQDTLQILRDQAGTYGRVTTLLAVTAGNGLSSLATVGIIGWADWRYLAVVAAGVPLLLAQSRLEALNQRAVDRSAAAGRRSAEVLSLAHQPATVVESGVFGWRALLTQRIEDDVRGWRRPRTRALWATSGFRTLGTTVVIVTGAAVTAFVAADVANGRSGVEHLATGLIMLAQLQAALAAVHWAASSLLMAWADAGRLAWLQDVVGDSVARRGRGAAPAESAGIMLDHVTYRYPGADGPAIDDVSLSLEPGELVAVVGENGAGKSTLTALLLGLRTPTAGRVWWGKADTASTDLDTATRALVTQRSARTEVTLREALTLHDRPTSDAILHGSLEAAGLAHDMFPEGLGTQLGAGWEGGVEPSVGQWHRVCLARALAVDSPSLVVLDEPSSASDPLAEDDILHRQVAALRQRAEATVVLVTHRLSTALEADRVVVLARGRVVGDGTHRELLARCETYRTLWEAQAAPYIAPLTSEAPALTQGVDVERSRKGR